MITYYNKKTGGLESACFVVKEWYFYLTMIFFPSTMFIPRCMPLSR